VVPDEDGGGGMLPLVGQSLGGGGGMNVPFGGKLGGVIGTGEGSAVNFGFLLSTW
jgi:hypothetical protein